MVLARLGVILVDHGDPRGDELMERALRIAETVISPRGRIRAAITPAHLVGPRHAPRTSRARPRVDRPR